MAPDELKVHKRCIAALFRLHFSMHAHHHRPPPPPRGRPNPQHHRHTTQILTYNVWIAPLVRWAPAENLDKICDFVRAQGADVVCMQEARGRGMGD